MSELIPITEMVHAPKDRPMVVREFNYEQTFLARPILDGRPEDVRRAIDRDCPVPIDGNVEGYVGHRPGRQRRWLHRAGEHAGWRRQGELHCADGAHLDHSGLARLLDQRARRSQDAQHEAEGDGPQHDAIVACRSSGPVRLDA